MVYPLQEMAQGLTLSDQARYLIGLYDPENGLTGDQTECTRFLVGCHSVKPTGSPVHLVTVVEREDCQGFSMKSRAFIHPDGEVVGLAAIASAPLNFISVYSSVSDSRTEVSGGARIWRLPPPSDGPDDEEKDFELDFADQPVESVEQLEFVASLPFDDFTVVKQVTAFPTETCSDLACIVGPPFPGSKYASTTGGASSVRGVSPKSSYLAILKGGEAGEYAIASFSQLRQLPSFTSSAEKTGSAGKNGLSGQTNALRWSPHMNASTVAVAYDSGVLGVDIRSMQPCFCLEHIHWPCVRDLDFNPNRDHMLATAGDDGCVCVWDLRQCGKSSWVEKGAPDFAFRSGPEPAATLSHHSYWVWSVRFHPTRDQLLISSGSDSSVCLYGLTSLSSDAKDSKQSPPVNCGPTQSSSTLSFDGLADGLLAKSDLQHEESVYAVDWSPVDPWIFASVDYEGHFVVNQVPDKVKLGILLQQDDEEEEEDDCDDGRRL